MKKKILFAALLSVVAQNAVLAGGGIVEFNQENGVSSPQGSLVRTFNDRTLTVSQDQSTILKLTSSAHPEEIELALPGNITNLYSVVSHTPVIVAEVTASDAISKDLYQVYLTGADQLSSGLRVSSVLANVMGRFVVEEKEIDPTQPKNLAFYSFDITKAAKPFLVVDYR